ncbi:MULTISPECIES: alpha/beta hydrolase [unclassified Bradyrhizobium]|jgi:pimeloyl-ACP methyl ester carboxylesterase|uniref:alpha/beta fold hydrolase n=1 Tax=unclassified Bradyrhizobium TaxID=2631580 RepID=UPI0003801FAB|nr:MULTISPECIES: alpha/beta hydrolase [unclassified Bradyrhizobium]MCK1313415.1 alpha/beta hydrolase [Bradyrhizobium sp. 23]
MEDWYPEALAAIATRLGVAFTDLAPPRSRRLRTPSGPDIQALDWGGQGPSAVLLHGGALTARTWDYVALGLRADFRIVALDLRGHGASDWANDYSIESCATDVVSVLDGLAIERTHLAGMSLGGIVACEVALRHPDRTASLTMVDVVSRPIFAATARMRGFISDFRGASTINEVVEMALAASPKSDPQRLQYRMRALLKRGSDGRLIWKNDRRRPTDFAAILRHLAGFEVRVHQMPAPFLLARGGDSLIVTEEAAHDFAARFPNGRWLNIPGAGHNVQEDNPRELANALRDFWGRRLRSMTLEDVEHCTAQDG